MTTLKNKKGVSLVELIAVIVIMGIIATVGGISVATIINDSKENAAVQAVSDVYAAAKNYYQVEGAVGQLDDLVEKDYLEQATADKLIGTVTISYNATTRSVELTESGEATANTKIKVKGYTVTLTDGEWKATAAA